MRSPLSLQELLRAPMPLSSRSYWVCSRSHRYSLLFALPLLCGYEALEAAAPIRTSHGVIRNGADVLITSLFSALLGRRGPLVFMAIVIGLSLVLIRRDPDRSPLRVTMFAGMFAESALVASVLGTVVGVATSQLVGPLRALSAGGGLPASALSRVTLSLGAGLYEELLFRVVLVALLSRAFRLPGLSRLWAGMLATLTGALIFSAFHYVGPLGEPLRVESFVFRALAGIAFSALYLARGFGITAWTHALYDIAVMLA